MRSRLDEETRWGMRGYSDGETWVPAVTTVLDILAPMPSEWIDTDALETGSLLHRALFLLAKGLPPMATSMTHSGFPRADAATEWIRRNGYSVVEAEMPRRSRFGFAGRPDALLARGKTRIIADFKFAESLPTRYEVQLEMYRHLDFGLRTMPSIVLLRISRAGDVQPKFLRPNAAHWAAALSALNIITWRINHGK